jgi:hypothetical protein
MTMTLAQIKTMFVKGSEWNADNSYNPGVNGKRTIIAVFAGSFQWKGENGMGGFTPWPMKSQVLEVRDGFIRFQIHKAKECNPTQNNWSVDDTLTLTRIGQ